MHFHVSIQSLHISLLFLFSQCEELNDKSCTTLAVLKNTFSYTLGVSYSKQLLQVSKNNSIHVSFHYDTPPVLGLWSADAWLEPGQVLVWHTNLVMLPSFTKTALLTCNMWRFTVSMYFHHSGISLDMYAVRKQQNMKREH